MVKRFQSATAAPQTAKSDADLAPLLFCLPGHDRVLVATVPKRAIWQRAVLASRSNVPRDRQAAAIIDFARGVLANPADGQHFEDRLMNPSDPLDVPDLFEPVAWLSTAWGEQTKDEKARKAAWDEYNAYLEEKAAAAAALVAGTEPDAEPDAEADTEFAVGTPTAGPAPVDDVAAVDDDVDGDVAVASAVL